MPIPDDPVLAGDESNRLHRWGYRHYREMFSERQLLGLGLLLRAIRDETEGALRDALLTVFSDFLRYQNMLCRYDTAALKCQDIFSVHGFPVGLIQCENNLLGIRGVGGGAFRHFVLKYARAKEYCAAPFEVAQRGRRNVRVPIAGETIAADLKGEGSTAKSAHLYCGPSQRVRPAPGSLDGVFTDPPYFDNVQYAELIDFCYVWLRRVLSDEHPEFRPETTRAPGELTGNGTAGRGLAGFTDGLYAVFSTFAGALRPGAPFVFTFHHNDPQAYVPLVVAVLDAELTCTAVLPAAAGDGRLSPYRGHVVVGARLGVRVPGARVASRRRRRRRRHSRRAARGHRCHDRGRSGLGTIGSLGAADGSGFSTTIPNPSADRP